MLNESIELYNNLTNENGFSALFIGKESQYNEGVQRIYNMHWNSVVTTFDLNSELTKIKAEMFDAIENYRKVNCIGIVDAEKRKNLFNKKKLIAFSVELCLTSQRLRYISIFDTYLKNLCDKLAIGGTLIVDGFTVDEYEKLDLNRHIWKFQKGTIFFFRCSDELRVKILADLGNPQSESVLFFSEGVEEYLADYLEDDNDSEYVTDSFSNVVYYYSSGKRRFFEKRKLIDGSGLFDLISTDEIDGKKFAPFLAEQYFYSFVIDSKNAPQWYAYENELTIKRNLEEDLLRKVRSWLNNPGAISKKKKERKQRIICVSGQSCSGKSVSIAKIAFQIFKEHEYPVVFIDRHADFSYNSERDPETQQTYTKSENLSIFYDFLDRLKDDGAKSVLLIWDLSAYYNDMKKYVDLARNLESRNINFTLLCSSYEFRNSFNISQVFPEVAFMLLPAALGKEEMSIAQSVLRNKANMPKNEVDKVMEFANAPGAQGNLLELIFFAFKGAREAMALGIKNEAWIESRDLFERLLKDRDSLGNTDLTREYEKRIIKSSLEVAFEKAGYNWSSDKIKQNNIYRLIYLLSFCTQLNRGVPVMLALDSCDLDVSCISLLSELNIIDFITDDSSDIKLYIRSRIEADILLDDSEAETLMIVDLVGDLIGIINPHSNESVLLLRDILFDIGPNSNDEELKERFNPHLKTILGFLADFRESGGDPRITLQEITITREYYCGLYRTNQINSEEFKNALARSIEIGEKTADDRMIDRSLKYKIKGEVSQQKMLALDPNCEVSFDGLLMDLSSVDLRGIMTDMSEAIQYEPDNAYYYVDWMKAALLLLSNSRISREERFKIMEEVLHLDANLNEEHTEVKEKEHYIKVFVCIRDLIDQEGDQYLKDQIAHGVPAAGFVLAFKEMGSETAAKLYSSYDEERLSENEIKTLNRICTECLERFADMDKKCNKLLIRIKKCVFNGGSWQNYQHNNFKDNAAGTTAISEADWKELYNLCNRYYKTHVEGFPYIRDSYNEIFLLALASAQVNLYTADSVERLFADAVQLLKRIRDDRRIKEHQVEGRMDSRQFLCDEHGRIVLLPGQATKKDNTHLPIKLDGMRKTVFANISDLNLQGDTINEGMRDYFAVSFGYMGLKAHRFDNRETVKFNDLGRVR